MLTIGTDGMVMDAKVNRVRHPVIERGEVKSISGIIVHQTGASTANSTLQSYRRNFANGAHFLIDKDGTIYQTAAVNRQTWHVGKLKARCLVENKCSPSDASALKKHNPAAEHEREIKKSPPDRFPSNQDSIGIELVGESTTKDGYVQVTVKQNEALKWLVTQLTESLSLDSREVFRHPMVSRKNPTEARTASW